MSPAGVISSQAYWYLARGTGVVALVLLTASVGLGVLGTVRFSLAPRWPRFAIDTLHRDASLLVIAVLALHIATSVLDGFAPIRLIDAVAPLSSSYRPLWLGLGALSFDLLLALVLTSLARRRLGYRSWRAVHWLAYASWPVAVLHGLGTGSDQTSVWMLAITAACVGVVLAAVWVRIGKIDEAHRALRAPATALSAVVPAGLIVFALAGPLRPGWARRAGTPANLLASHARAVGRPSGASAPATRSSARPSSGPGSLRTPFSAALSGTMSQSSAGGGTIVDLALTLSGGAQGELRVRIAGSPSDDGALAMTGSQVDLTAPGLTSPFQGQVTSLAGQRFIARVADASGSTLDLRADLNIDTGSDAVTGTLTGDGSG